MTEPCTEKENIQKLFDLHASNTAAMNEMRVTQVGIEKDVSHIKGRIDNGMSHTLDEIKKFFLEFKGDVKHHSDVINRIEDIGWWAVKIGLAGAVVGGIVWLAKSGWKP